MPLSTIFQLYHGVSFIGGGNRNTRRKPPTCGKSLTNFITQCCIKYKSPWAGFELPPGVWNCHARLVHRTCRTSRFSCL